MGSVFRPRVVFLLIFCFIASVRRIFCILCGHENNLATVFKASRHSFSGGNIPVPLHRKCEGWQGVCTCAMASHWVVLSKLLIMINQLILFRWFECLGETLDAATFFFLLSSAFRSEKEPRPSRCSLLAEILKDACDCLCRWTSPPLKKHVTGQGSLSLYI